VAYREKAIDKWLVNPGTMRRGQVCLRHATGLSHLSEVGVSPFCAMATAATARGARIWLTRMGVLALPSNMRGEEMDKKMSQSAVAWLNDKESLTSMSVLRVSALTQSWQQEDSVAMARSLQWYGRWLDRMQDAVDVSSQREWLQDQEQAWAPVMGVVGSVERAARDAARERENAGDNLETLYGELRAALTALNLPSAADMASTPDGVREAMALADCPERWERRSGLYVSELLMDAIETCSDLIRERALFHMQ